MKVNDSDSKTIKLSLIQNSKVEVKSTEATQKTEKLTKSQFQAMDANKDGEVTEAEFNAAAAQNAQIKGTYMEYVAAFNTSLNSAADTKVTEAKNSVGKIFGELSGSNLVKDDATMQLRMVSFISDKLANSDQVDVNGLASEFCQKFGYSTDTQSEVYQAVNNTFTKIALTEGSGEGKYQVSKKDMSRLTGAFALLDPNKRTAENLTAVAQKIDKSTNYNVIAKEAAKINGHEADTNLALKVLTSLDNIDNGYNSNYWTAGEQNKAGSKILDANLISQADNTLYSQLNSANKGVYSGLSNNEKLEFAKAAAINPDAANLDSIVSTMGNANAADALVNNDLNNVKQDDKDLYANLSKDNKSSIYKKYTTDGNTKSLTDLIKEEVVSATEAKVKDTNSGISEINQKLFATLSDDKKIEFNKYANNSASVRSADDLNNKIKSLANDNKYKKEKADAINDEFFNASEKVANAQKGLGNILYMLSDNKLNPTEQLELATFISEKLPSNSSKKISVEQLVSDYVAKYGSNKADVIRETLTTLSNTESTGTNASKLSYDDITSFMAGYAQLDDNNINKDNLVTMAQFIRKNYDNYAGIALKANEVNGRPNDSLEKGIHIMLAVDDADNNAHGVLSIDSREMRETGTKTIKAFIESKNLDEAAVNKRLDDASKHMGTALNAFAKAAGAKEIPDDVLVTLLNKLQTAGSLNFKDGGNGYTWVNNNFKNQPEDVKTSIRASLKEIANYNDLIKRTENTFTIHDIANTQHAIAILSSDPNNITADNMRVVQSAIDKEALQGKNNTEITDIIISELNARGVKLGITKETVKAILDAKAGGDGNIYNNQSANGKAALKASADAIKNGTLPHFDVSNFDNFADTSIDGNDTYQYAKNDVIVEAQEFAKNYVNDHGNNDGNLSLEEFIAFNKNKGLTDEQTTKIFNMINLDNGASGITADEFASYILAVDSLDTDSVETPFDGVINSGNYNMTALLATDENSAGALENFVGMMKLIQQRYFPNSAAAANNSNNSNAAPQVQQQSGTSQSVQDTGSGATPASGSGNSGSSQGVQNARLAAVPAGGTNSTDSSQLLQKSVSTSNSNGINDIRNLSGAKSSQSTYSGARGQFATSASSVMSTYGRSSGSVDTMTLSEFKNYITAEFPGVNLSDEDIEKIYDKLVSLENTWDQSACLNTNSLETLIFASNLNYTEYISANGGKTPEQCLDGDSGKYMADVLNRLKSNEDDSWLRGLHQAIQHT